MSNHIFKADFFQRPALCVAPDLLGHFLVFVDSDGQTKKLVLTEVEAYVSESDLANHASKGLTKRTAPMFEAGGIFYIYLVYGLHQMLNFVVDRKGYPAAVLVRSVKGLKGPGRLTKHLGLDISLSGQPITPESGIWVELNPERSREVRRGIKKTARVGVDYAGIWARKPYRFLIED